MLQRHGVHGRVDEVDVACLQPQAAVGGAKGPPEAPRRPSRKVRKELGADDCRRLPPCSLLLVLPGEEIPEPLLARSAAVALGGVEELNAVAPPQHPVNLQTSAEKRGTDEPCELVISKCHA